MDLFIFPLYNFRYIFSFAIGAGPVTGIIIPELSSTRTRGKIMGFSFSTHWVGIKTSSVIFPLLKALLCAAFQTCDGTFQATNFKFYPLYQGLQFCGGIILP